MTDVYKLLGLKKVYTTAYHPQTDGLVERSNRTLTDMLSKKVLRSSKDWDVQLTYVLFAYRASPQQSTGESPFFLLYGRDPVLPSEKMLKPSTERDDIDVDDYRSEMATLLKLPCCFSTQISHIWYPLSVFLRFLCDMVPNMTHLLLKQHSTFNSAFTCLLLGNQPR